MTMPDATTIGLTLLAALAGTGAGWLHFSSLSRIAGMITEGKLSAVGWQVGRMILMAGLLWLFVQGGALVLLAGAAGVLAGRALVMRRPG